MESGLKSNKFDLEIRQMANGIRCLCFWRLGFLGELVLGRVGSWASWFLGKLVSGRVGFWASWLLANCLFAIFSAIFFGGESTITN